MRRTLTFLIIVALVVLLAAAVNRAVLVELSCLVGSRAGVSLFWVGAGAAALVVVAGLVAALLASRSAVRDQHKLETELEEVYRRLREAEARAPQVAGLPAEAEATAVTEPQTAVAPAPAAPGAGTPAGEPGAESQGV